MVSRLPPPEDGSSARPQRTTSAIVLGLVLAVTVGFWWFSGPDADPGSTAVDTSSSTPAAVPSEEPSEDPSTDTDEPSAEPSAEPSSTTPPSIDPESGLPTVYLLDLPPEAAETVELIDRGPPYPYDKDGSTFGNYEGFLPDHERGYYQEFTVETPGSYDRGARRIVEGAEGELYWTDDHYASFSRIWL
ncbi:ribonuclease domain-containing protein [Nocardioides sp.]|uniref:ribonuclease domain-containing protein n=1 Tax=Nocardioides sp. TaxID=35761 RepID=UPI002B2756DB|nr:ribonuclease domain-containing protein [Nocardioides sp.]